MSDREIINAKQGLPMWWKPGIAFLKEEWLNNEFLSHFRNKKSTERNCSCDSPKLVELWEHDSCIRGRTEEQIKIIKEHGKN